MIGIRLANNTFFPILDEGQRAPSYGRTGKKRLILTTVKDNQTTVQIDLYRGAEKDVSKDSYLATLTVENIGKMKAGDPEIDLIMGTDAEGQLDVHAHDRAGGAENSLSVSLKELPEDAIRETPNFAIGDDFATPDTLGEYRWDDDAASAPAEEVPEDGRRRQTAKAQDYREVRTERRSPILIVILLAIGVIAILVLAYFLLRTKPADGMPALPNQSGPVSSSPAKPVPPPGTQTQSGSGGTRMGSDATAAAEPVAPATANSTQAAGPQATPTTPPDGVWYRIAFGDTLWDLAYSFYNNPRQFGRIAQRNNILNPNRIYGGNQIFIPLSKSELQAREGN